MKKFLLLILFFYIAINAAAQTDTIVIIKTDTVFVQEEHDLMYKFFVENRGEETNHLWKMNLVDIGLLKLNVGYEHRLAKSWSIEGYLSYGDKGDFYTHNEGFGTSISMGLDFEQLFKYYYNLNRREKLGKRTDGFRGNYFASSFWIEAFEDKSQETDSIFAPGINRINLGIKYGIQRRIGNLGYIEFYAGVYYRWETIEHFITSGISGSLESQKEYNDYLNPVLGVRAGFAIDSFGSLRRMIKD